MKSEILKIYVINAASITSKLNLFDEVLCRLKPHIWILQETKFNLKESISSDASSMFEVYNRNRQTSQDGGVAIGVAKNIESTFNSEGETEVISVVVNIGVLSMRVIAG